MLADGGAHVAEFAGGVAEFGYEAEHFGLAELRVVDLHDVIALLVVGVGHDVSAVIDGADNATGGD